MHLAALLFSLRQGILPAEAAGALLKHARAEKNSGSPEKTKKEPEREHVQVLWSEWRDLNSRPLDPQSSALPAAPHPDSVLLPFIGNVCYYTG